MQIRFKKLTAVLLAAVLLCTYIFGITPLPELKVSAASQAVTTDYVNLRTGAGTGYSIITTVYKGASITVLDTSNSSWYKVQTSSGSTGYMSSDYIRITSSQSPSGSSSSGTTTAYVNLRSGAGTNYSILATISIGSSVTILDSLTGWYKVRTAGGREGYMSADYVKVTSSPSDNPGQTPGPGASDTSLGTATTTVYLNLRSGAGTSYSVITTLATGVTVTILDTSNSSWYKVKTSSGAVGYVSTDYIKVSLNNPSTPTPDPEPPAETPVGTATTTDYLNLRAGAGTSYSVITTLATGVTVTILDTSNSSWYKVKTSSGAVGYVSTQYLKINSSTEPSPPDDSSVGTATTTDYLNLRSGPGTSYSIITTLSRGAKVTLLDVSNSTWYKVKTSSGNVGYLNTGYLNADISTPAEPEKPTEPEKPEVQLSLDVSSASKTVGETCAINASVKNNDGAAPSASSSDESVAAVALASQSADVYSYTVTAKKAGTAVITFTLGSVSKTFSITVSQPAAPEISLNADNCTLAADQTYEILATVSNRGENEVTAQSSNTAVATVALNSASENVYTFVVSAKAMGTAKITVSVGSVSKEFIVFVKGFAKTTTALNLRKGPSLSDDVITVLSAGTYLTVLDSTTNSQWIKVSTGGGTEGYVSADYIVYVSGSIGNITIAHQSASIPVGKTFYNKAIGENSSSNLIWRSADTSIATVSDGYIYGVSEGTTKIYATDISGNNTAVCDVTVTSPESVRFVYSSPNIVGVGAPVKAVAITGEEREAVKFIVDYGDGRTEAYEVTEFTADNKAADGDVAETRTKLWEKELTFENAGKYNVEVYSYANGSWSSEGKSMVIYVSEAQNPNESCYGERRASDKIIENISNFEGLCSTVYPDTLAYDIPTLGYGYVLSVGELFYNNLTQKEAWAMLCATINERSYTTEVNKFVKNNNMKVSQGQFDALVCFSYNVGAGFWNNTSTDCDIRESMLNAVDVTSLDFSSGGYAGTLKFTASVYNNIGDSSAATYFSAGTSVTVIDAYTEFTDTKNSVWYKISVGGGEYWIRNAYVKLNNRESLVRDLKYIDAVAIGSQFLQWHMAGGVCLPGLLYRRLAEAKVFSFANYDECAMSSPRYRVNTYGYFYPSCLAKYEQ